MVRCVQAALSDVGVVVVATDVVTTTALAAVCRPDLLIIDATDESCARQTRAMLVGDFRTAFIPVLYIVDGDRAEGVIDASFGGADDYVVYPFDERDLAARARAALRRAAALRGMNPLTGLPANALIAEALERRLAAGAEFACLHVDVDGFKTLNDQYGFARGDNVIRTLADCIVGVIEGVGPTECFAGHVGGDDFVVLCPRELAGLVATRIIELFDASSSGSTISIGIATPQGTLCGASDVANTAAAAKRRAKRKTASSWAAASPEPAAGAIVTVEL
jgi:diguanylate cyclase (GGDEF)-like protein